MRRTKIIATVGPATDDSAVMDGLIESGVDVLRINFSHGGGDSAKRRADAIRASAERVGREVAILADLQGPKIRVERFADGPVTLKPGQPFILDAADAETPGDETRVGVSYAGLPRDVEPGDCLLLDDGLISMRVDVVRDGRVHCIVEQGGELGDRKGLNVQGGGLSVPGISPEDLDDIATAAEIGVEYLAVSFPRNADDMNEARQRLQEAGSRARLVAKIERTEAIDNLEDIIDASNAVLVARGDLGVEIGDAELPGLQKRIISMALSQNRVVVTATQMMQSMVENPIPTRAEVLDVANAVIDGTDAVMLSAETAIGKYPVKTVEAVHRICLGAERHCAEQGTARQLNVRFQRIDQAIAMAAMFMATNLSVQAIVALTESGSTAQWLSRVRSSVPIFALSPSEVSRRRMALYRDVYPIAHDPQGDDVEVAIVDGVSQLFHKGLLASGDRVILTMGDRLGNQGGTNTLRLIQVGPDGLPEHQTELDLR